MPVQKSLETYWRYHVSSSEFGETRYALSSTTDRNMWRAFCESFTQTHTLVTGVRGDKWKRRYRKRLSAHMWCPLSISFGFHEREVNEGSNAKNEVFLYSLPPQLMISNQWQCYFNISSSHTDRITMSFLNIYPYHPSFSAGSLDRIKCPHRADISFCWSTSTGAPMSSVWVHKRTSLIIFLKVEDI